MSKPSCLELKVLDLTGVGQSARPGEFFVLRLESPGWSAWRPGQFVMLRPEGWGRELIWGRPFSICHADDECLEVFFQVVGRGTARLAKLAPGDVVAAWGPLGNGFAVEPGARTLLLAGGVGIAPFKGYIRRHPEPGKLALVLAHRLPEECYPFAELSASVAAQCLRETCPEDIPHIAGQLGERMREYADGLVLACGPTPFLRTVRSVAIAEGIRAQVSLENRMACGVGACLGCVCTDGRGEHVKTCTSGPVFWAKDVTL